MMKWASRSLLAYIVGSAIIASPTSAATAKRSSSEKRHFRKEHPCPATHRINGPCPGYVIDHVVPLKRGGPDKPENMQWQTTEEAKVKDRWE